MTKIRLQIRFLKNRSNGNRDLFRKQKLLCVNPLRKSKRDYFTKLNKKKEMIVNVTGKQSNNFIE